MTQATPAGLGGRSTSVDDARRLAHSTLGRGTRFLTELADEPRLARPWIEADERSRRARFFANCLAELDRFLHILMDETAPALALRPAPGQRNAANKIAELVGYRADSAPDHRRLRALGRTHACLWHCHGLVRRPDSAAADWMTAGWPPSVVAGPDPDQGRYRGSTDLRQYRMGERLSPAGAELAAVAAFYHDLGDRLLALPAD